MLAVPMLRENDFVGVFALNRQEVRPFSEKQIALVTNFAAQSVIAIENARLLGELRELNQGLEKRVTDQVGEMERMSRLRRLVLRRWLDLGGGDVREAEEEEEEATPESHRREVTALFCDLRGFAGLRRNAGRRCDDALA